MHHTLWAAAGNGRDRNAGRKERLNKRLMGLLTMRGQTACSGKFANARDQPEPPGYLPPMRSREDAVPRLLARLPWSRG